MIAKTDHIVTAWATLAAGPGWSNSPVWVLLRDGGGKLRVECIQPKGHTIDMAALFGVSAACTTAMVRAVELYRCKKGRK